MRHALCAFFVLYSLFSISRFAAADTEVQVPAIIKEGTPGDILMEDPVILALGRPTGIHLGSGGIQKNISDEISVPIIGTGLPGNFSQFRGLGRSAEDTDVQALGVPLNPPQGGGFDLSIFPQFIWAGYEYQAGPALGTFDPRGTAGSLTLVPWSASALGSRVGTSRAAAFYSSAKLFQISGAFSNGESFAAVAGNSSGDAHGPSGALSGRWRLGSERQALSFHLLATDLDANTPGPGNVTPDAHQRTIRVIPLLQVDTPISTEGVLKSSVFYDWNYLRYDDPAFSSLPATQDRIQQLGFENALLWNEWKIGAGVRGVKYQTLGYEDQTEGMLHLLVSRAMEVGSFIVEPSLRGVGVSRYGILPEASLGVRQELGSESASGNRAAWFARGGLSRHFPSLLNRFYDYPGFPGFSGFKGNPALQPERDWTGTLGAELKRQEIEASIQLYGQLAEDAQVRAPLDSVTDTVLNQGTAKIASVTPSVLVRPLGWLDLGMSATLSASKISQTDRSYLGLPGFLGLLSASVHSSVQDQEGAPLWQVRAVARLSSTSLADAADGLLPAYQELNLDASALLGKAWKVAGRLENVLNRDIQLVKGFPSLGRTGSVVISAGW